MAKMNVENLQSFFAQLDRNIPIYLFIYLSIYLPTYLPIYLSINLRQLCITKKWKMSSKNTKKVLFKANSLLTILIYTNILYKLYKNISTLTQPS